MSSSDDSEYKEVIQEGSNKSESETQSEKPAHFEEPVAKTPVKKTRFKLRIPKHLIEQWQTFLPVDKRGKKIYEYGFTRALNSAKVSPEDFQIAKSKSLSLWGPDVWLRKLAESGCGQNEVYSGRGQSKVRDIAQSKFLLDMMTARKEVATTQYHVPATSIVPATAPARDSQGMHKAFIFPQGIHKAFKQCKAFTRHSNSVRHSQAFARYSLVIHESFHTISAQGIHDAFHTNTTPGTFKVSEVANIVDACVKETISTLKQHGQRIPHTFAVNIFKNAAIKKLVDCVETVKSPHVKADILKRYGETLNWIHNSTKKRSHLVEATPTPKKRQREAATKTKKEHGEDPTKVSSLSKLVDLNSTVPSARKSRRVTVKGHSQDNRETFTRHSRDIHVVSTLPPSERSASFLHCWNRLSNVLKSKVYAYTQYLFQWRPALWRKQYIELTKKRDLFVMVNTIGFGIVEKAIKLPRENDDLYKRLDKVKTEPIFEKLVPSFGQMNPQFGTRKRFQTTPRATSKIHNWNKLGKQLETFLTTHFTYEFNLAFVRLGSKPLCPAQAVHCDHIQEGMYANSDGHYGINVIVPISFKDDTFLDIRPLGSSRWIRVLLRRGDTFLFRGDVAHRGVEHMLPYTHYRIHCYCDIKGEKRKENQTFYVGCPFEKQSMWSRSV